jgi:XTP/dITP diphosphohydrolase
MRIIVASKNKGKLEEIKRILRGYDVFAYSDFIEPFEIKEDGKSFKENAIIKAKEVAKFFPNDIVLADDSGISVEALDGEPGIYSARYAGDGASDKENLDKLISELKKRNIKTSKAFYTSAIALATPYGIFTTHGFMRGRVIDTKRGEKGFGYDPIFIPNGFDKTLGELDSEIKDKISHRFKALTLAKLILDVLK